MLTSPFFPFRVFYFYFCVLFAFAVQYLQLHHVAVASHEFKCKFQYEALRILFFNLNYDTTIMLLDVWFIRFVCFRLEILIYPIGANSAGDEGGV